MKHPIFVSEGLSQQTRKFKELAKSFVAVNNMTLEQLLKEICKYEKQDNRPLVINDNDIPKLINAIESYSDGNIEPSAALYTVFAKLLGRIQERINELPERRIDFYFRTVLGERANKARGDHAHVVIPIEFKGFRYNLPKGTKFTAGTNEDGEPIEFESVKHAELNDVQVQKIYTLDVPQKGMPTISEIPIYTPSQALENKDMIPYPLFGSTRSGDIAAHSKFARFGLAISSRLLYLNDGARCIIVKLYFDADSVKGTLLESAQSAEEFSQFFKNAFRISLTTAEGWYDVNSYQLKSHILDEQYDINCLGLTFQLSDMDPAIVDYDPTIHGADYTLSSAVMQITVNPSTSEDPWRSLKKTKLHKVSLEVQVTNCKRLALSNDSGQLSTNTSIQPFGPLPTVGSSLIVGCEEVRGKKLTSLKIHGNWLGLPHSNGFKEWYKLYPVQPQNSDFKASIAALLGGVWTPTNQQAPVLQDLFHPEVGPISNELTINCEKVLGGRTFNNRYDAENFEFSPNAKDGFFKIQLVNPEKAFMHQEYPKTLCEILIQQVIKKEVSNLPNQPYTPELENLSVDYTATAEINLQHPENSDGQVLFLHPWGFSEIAQLSPQSKALFLGLSPTAASKNVNLYFHLNRDSDNFCEANENKFKWKYLGENDEWKPIPSENILYNTTANFTTSGIVSLTIPKNFLTDSNLMPQGLCWIRLEPHINWTYCSRLFSVYAQAVEVVRSNGFGKKNSFNHCKPGSINELAQSISGITDVYQLEESFGGKPEEDREEMQTRVAEYLYHRNRSLTARDCERLILEEFPEVHLVKCFAGLSPENPNQATPGHMLVVPVSPLCEDSGHIWDPCLSGKTLENIKLFVKKICSPFATVSIKNPQFEKIQIHCQVNLVEDSNEGIHLLELNQQICKYISPWNNDSPSHFFGWSLNKEHLREFIQKQPYVESIQNFSVHRFHSKDHSKYSVIESDQSSSNFIHGTTPWSILTPTKKHCISIFNKKLITYQDPPLTVEILK